MASKQNSFVRSIRLEEEDFKAFVNFMTRNFYLFIQHYNFRVGDYLFDSIVIA
jgi:hypothetical protein